MMTSVQDLISNRIVSAMESLGFSVDPSRFRIEIPDPQFGEYSTNVAMVYAKPFGKRPKELAEALREVMLDDRMFSSAQIAGPGFLNLRLDASLYRDFLKSLLNGDPFKWDPVNQKQKIQLEFVSANPTGPLTVGHGRQAILGDVLSKVMSKAGFDVTREYYFNDSGRQMKLLARSLWVRYQESFGKTFPIPEGGYHGEYLREIGQAFAEQEGPKYVDIWDVEVEALFLKHAKDKMFAHIKCTLEALDIHFDVFTSEGDLFTEGLVQKTFELLKAQGAIYEKDGAVWFEVSKFADEEDKVLVRSDTMPTYFFTDIANHYQKYQRKFHRIYDIWGADHHGHITRMKAALKALNVPEDFFHVILHQMVSLRKEGESIKMSTRSGEFYTLDELLKEVGPDALRFFYAMVDKDAQMVFDIDLAKTQSNDNPVFYVQYAYARICRLIENAQEKGIMMHTGKDLELLDGPEERLLIRDMMIFPDMITETIQGLSPHRICGYVITLVAKFHQYYADHLFVDPKAPEQSNARLQLAIVVKRMIVECLDLLGVSAPERM